MRATSTFLAAALFAAPVLCQTTWILPAEYEFAWGRTSGTMLGGNSTRTQTVFASPFVPGTVITGMSIRPAVSTLDANAFTATVEIRLSSTTAVPGSLSSTWANNVGNDEVVVLPQQSVSVPAMSANRGTGVFLDFTFNTPFVFGLNGNPNLCVDFLVYGRSAGASWSTDRAFAATNGRATNWGYGCSPGLVTTTSTGGTYVNGSTVNFNVAGGLPNTLLLLVLSPNEKEVAPGVPGPFPLDLIGAAPGCNLLIPLDILLATISDGSGGATLPLTITGLSQFGFGAQWIALVPPTPTNPAGIETLRGHHVWIGPEVVQPNGQAIYDLFNVAATTATTSVNAMPVVRFTTL
ncbi:MAG: hypothetical protein JNK78_18135 [Planctomycetes bacterium]|nr:hypothetical protein [Planctomycetota bacterium]